MKLKEWLFGKKYMDWEDYKKRIHNMEEKYWDEQSQKHMSK
jgi:hypothetical protein